MEYYTYAYLRKDKTPYYIGKGKGRRAYLRRRDCINPPQDRSRILILKRGLSEEEAFNHEIYMIAILGRKDLGTGILRNRTNGGEGASGTVVKEETRQKMARAHLGIPLSSETRRKIGEGNRGKKVSVEARQKIGDGNRGKTISAETRSKTSQTLTGREITPLHRERIARSLSGKRKSPEHRKNLVKSWGGREVTTNRQVWESTVDGYRSTAAGVAHHNRFIGADPKAKVRVS